MLLHPLRRDCRNQHMKINVREGLVWVLSVAKEHGVRVVHG